jgi:hypothetical protein
LRSQPRGPPRQGHLQGHGRITEQQKGLAELGVGRIALEQDLLGPAPTAAPICRMSAVNMASNRAVFKICWPVGCVRAVGTSAASEGI